ncbi:hypothetical protein [Sphingobacterium faecium]|uniref:hypothetical protein n=1 Tax=Sphingobacterium faecium TaxID=34087 RepID=UPI0032096188
MCFRYCIATILIIFSCTTFSSCFKKDLFDESKKLPDQKDSSTDDDFIKSGYVYPFGNETTGADVEITLTLKSDETPAEELAIHVPPLKYNKSLLFMLTQDDCKQSAFSMTWAAIHGKPIDISDPKRKYYYDIENLEAYDLPPKSYALGKTLGSTDGFGNEVRFRFTTTLAPEWDFMYAPTSVKPGFSDNYFRFYMKAGLRWNNVRELLNWGNAIAFHDVKTSATSDVDSLLKHFDIAQEMTQKAVEGRRAKFFVEPNGNKNYLIAAQRYADIRTMTAQSGATALIPYQVYSDLNKTTLPRVFLDTVSQAKQLVLSELAVDSKHRRAIHLGVHETDHQWAQFLLWLNNHYGKDGQDVIWFPSQEEYYEYNYYRQHSDPSIYKDGDQVKIKVKLPNQTNFYYPSLTLNIPGIKMSMIASVHTNESVTGLSYGDFGDGITINFDCRKFVVQHAHHYVNKYLARPTKINLEDAKYHIGAIKEGDQKKQLLQLLD